MSRFEQFTVSVFSITRYWNKIASEEMRGLGLKGSYALYLITLSSDPNGITATRLAELTQRDKADVSRAISQFQQQGLVEAYGENRYRAPIVLTQKGKDLTGQIRKKAEHALQMAGEGLSEEMRQSMYQALEIIASNLKDMSEDKPDLD
ncbi:MAG: MarR family winged helix-turn-helix transcriptional regulator [Lachnospiraceae bacterium]|nr:MarR family winged helix-turn-helix transcriptional regulator [Lachnospiraceae bacterium]